MRPQKRSSIKSPIAVRIIYTLGSLLWSWFLASFIVNEVDTSMYVNKAMFYLSMVFFLILFVQLGIKLDIYDKDFI